MHYASHRDEINAQKRAAYSERTKIFSTDRIDLLDEIIGKSIGAKHQNYDILDFETSEIYHLAEGSKLQNKEVFAGKGTNKEYRKAWKYAEKYNNSPEEWQHVKAEGVLTTPDGDRKAEIHWSQCENIGKVDMFVKKWLED